MAEGLMAFQRETRRILLLPYGTDKNYLEPTLDLANDVKEWIYGVCKLRSLVDNILRGNDKWRTMT